MGIYHAYDIRGLYESEITINTAVEVAIGFTKTFNPKSIFICHDVRHGSEELANALVDAFLDAGVHVYFAGLTTTPMLYYGVNKYNCDGGIVVTASHNPKEYIGFKICREKALPVGMGSGLEKIQEVATSLTENSINEFFEECKSKNIQKGKLTNISLTSEYIKFLAPYFDVQPIKIAFDCSSGSASVIIKEVLENTQIDPILINDYPDGDFPAHEPNPMKAESIEELSDVVKEHECDFGIIYDGDADRLAAVDENGRRVKPDIIAILISKFFLEQTEDNKNQTILYDLRTTKALAQIIHSHGAISHKTRVGHSFIKADMRKYDAIFASELSGHYYYKNFFYCDNAIITTFLLIKAVQNSGMKLSQLVEQYTYFEKSEETNFKVKKTQPILEKIKTTYPVLDEIDGITIGNENWWANIRSSNTEPLLRVNIEADTQELLELKFDELKKIITEN
jgi:phosphomannomutase